MERPVQPPIAGGEVDQHESCRRRRRGIELGLGAEPDVDELARGAYGGLREAAERRRGELLLADLQLGPVERVDVGGHALE